MIPKIALLFACAIVIYLANTGRFFGVFANRFFPCMQNPEHSFPCYGWIDLGIIVVALVIAAYSSGRIVVHLFKPQE